jgi:hypothetical protein
MIPALGICFDQFSQLSKIDRAIQLVERSGAEIGEHADGDGLFPVASRAAQDNCPGFLEAGTNIVEPVRGDECAPYRLYLAPGQAAKPDFLRPADQENVLIAPYRITFYGQPVGFPQVFIAQ